MSVMTFSGEEIADMFGQYVTLELGPLVRDLGLPSLDAVRDAFVAFHYANVAAYARQYAHLDDGRATFEPIAAILAKQGPTGVVRVGCAEGQRRFVRTLRHMLYNTVTNNGADFLPAGARATLDQVCVGLAEHLAGI